MEEQRRRPWWRGWWWKGPLLLLPVLVLFAPWLAAPLVRSALASALEGELGGQASFDDFALSWPGDVTATGLRVTDPAGRPVVLLSTLEGSVDARALLDGHVAIDALLHEVEVHLRQQADGSWRLGEPPEKDQDDDEESTDSDAEGPPVSGDLRLDGGRVVLHGLDGEVTLENLELGGSLPADLSTLATFHAAFDARGEAGPAGSLRANGKLTLGSLADVDPRDIEAALEVSDLTLAALQPVLALWLPERIPSGTIDASFTLAGEPDRLRLAGRATVADLLVEVLSEDDEEPLVIQDPRVVLELEAEVAPETLDVDLKLLRLDSRFARCDAQGRITGLKAWTEGGGEVLFDDLQGTAVFVPDRLTELLGPDLPLQLAGDGERRISFALNGKAAEMDLASLLSGCEANAKVELGDFLTTGIVGAGDLEFQAKDGRATWSGNLQANDGTLDVNGAIELGAVGQADATPTTSFVVNTRNLETNAELAPLLSLLHPAFAAVETLQASEVSGRITSRLELEYVGPLTNDLLAGGWESFPKQGIRGSGSFNITSARLDGTPALGEMLAYLGVDTTQSIDIRPIEFTIDQGQLTYSKPWSWTISDVKTTFTGSVGLDQTLALSWNVPVTDEVAAEHRLLKVLKGTVIQLPIRGTVKNPRLEWQDALGQLATEGVGEELRDELLERLGVGGDGDTDDPNALLEEADRLWDEDKKVEAAAIYERIRKDFNVSLTYALNRKRIKKRGKYQE